MTLLLCWVMSRSGNDCLSLCFQRLCRGWRKVLFVVCFVQRSWSYENDLQFLFSTEWRTCIEPNGSKMWAVMISLQTVISQNRHHKIDPRKTQPWPFGEAQNSWYHLYYQPNGKNIKHHQLWSQTSYPQTAPTTPAPQMTITMNHPDESFTDTITPLSNPP